MAGCPGGCFDLRTSKTDGEAASSLLTLSPACKTPPLPFKDSKSRAALVLPLNIRFEDVRTKFSSHLFQEEDLERRFWRHLPSSRKLLISPACQLSKQHLREEEWTLGLELQAGL